MVESVEEMDVPVAAAAEPSVIVRAEPVAPVRYSPPRPIQKPTYYGGIPTRVIKSCKQARPESVMSFSTCSSLYSSDSEEEIVAKKPCLAHIFKNQGVNTDTPVVALSPQPTSIDGVIRVIPLRPVYTIQMIPYNKHKEFDEHAPRFPTPIEEYHGIPIDVTNIQPPYITTLEDLQAQQMRKGRLRVHLTEEQYRIVWHATRADGEEKDVMYSVPFTTDKSNFLMNGDFTTIPAETWAKTLEFAMQRGEKLRSLRRMIVENVPPKQSRSAARNARRRYRNDNRIVSTHRHPHIVSTCELD